MATLLRSLQPKSISGLVLLGFALVTAPLIGAIIAASVQVDRLARRSQMAVFEAELATRHSRALLENLVAMERSLGQYQVLGDAGLYQTYLVSRQRFRDAAAALGSLDLDAAHHARLTALMRGEARVFNDYAAAKGDPASVTQLTDAFASLSEQARSILGQSRALVEREANNAIVEANAIKKTMLLQALAVIPTAMALMALFAILITKPMWELDRAVRRLGRGDFSQPIRIRGPRDLQELSAALEWLRERILELENQKAAFLRHISHELKTPLTAVREGAELLVDGTDGELGSETRQIAEIMHDSSLQLQKLIENLLHFARTQNPMSKARKNEAVALKTVVEQVVKEQGLALASKDLSVDQALEDVVVLGDPEQLKVVVDNLVSNAVKFSPRGGTIKIRVNATAKNGIIHVEDAGPGIHPEDRSRIFEPFFQGRHTPESYVRGSGLGLSITREYVEKHHGSIDICESDTGAHFEVSLPLARAP